jgi:glycosyltransferase involved in cell wall biosynthesis
MRTTDYPKILFLTRSLEFGGAQRQLVELATGLHRAGWGVTVATFYPGGALASRLHEEGVTTVHLGKAGRWDVFGFILRLMRLLRRERPDIAHGYLDLSNILLSVCRWFVPQTRIVWGVRASNMDGGRYDALFRIECRLSVILSRFADLIICNSHAGLAHHASSGFVEERMIVIPNGIDVTRFRPDPQARDEVRKEWNIGTHQRLIGLVGRLDPMKDQAGFLRAAARVATADPHVRFVCVGDGVEDYRKEVVELSKSLGIADRVVWSAARSDAWRVHNALDVAVSASSFGEGFSNTIAEAMATGVPCVVTNVGDSAALLGRLGWVCRPDDDESLANAILEALNALPVDGAVFRHRILSNYSSAELVKRTAAQLLSLLGRAQPLPNASVPRAP